MVAGAFRQSGVSLIEIVIAFAVTAVFVAFTLPGANIGPGRAGMVERVDTDQRISTAVDRTFSVGQWAVAAYDLEAGGLFFPSFPLAGVPVWDAQPSFAGMTVACQATARHSPSRFTNVPVLKYSMTAGESPCTSPTNRNATTAVLP